MSCGEGTATESTVLTTKLSIPRSKPDVVSRPRLLEKLRAVVDHRLVLVSAPAGFGKTTLLSEWVSHGISHCNVAWLSLEEADNDPARFWSYLLASLKTVHPSVGEMSLNLLRSPQRVSPESVLTPLINELSAVSGDVVLVLDDYHLIQSKAIHAGVAFFLEHMPAQMHMVIATRADPPLSLAQLRGKGMMLEIRTDDLRFTRDEAAALFGAVKAPRLSAEDVGRLDDRTEGWVVGLKMAGLALQQRSDVGGFIATFAGSQRYIMDYLMEQVLERQSNEVRDFLVETSVLERLTAPLCDAVTGRTDGRDMLLKLEHGNLFIAPLDESRQWYRYEHLFLDLLRHELEVRLGAGHIAELHRRASRWYEKDYPDDAIHHALEAGDWVETTRLVRERWTRKIQNGEFATVLGWLQKVPEEVRNGDVDLCGMYGILLVTAGQLDAAEKVADGLDQRASDNKVLRGQVSSLRTRIALGRGEVKRAIELGTEALALLPQETPARSFLCYILGYVHWQRGQFKEAEPLLTEACESGRRSGNRVAAAGSLALLAGAECSTTGRLRRPFELYRQVVELAGATSAGASAHQGLGWTLYEWNDLEAAGREIERAIELVRLMGGAEFLARQHALLAHCRLAQGKESEASKEMEQAQVIAQNSGSPHDRAEHAAYHIRMALRRNDLASATEWGRRLAEDAGALPFYHVHVPLRLLIAQGEKAAAAQRLQVLYEESFRRGLRQEMIYVRVCQVLAADTTESALGFLADALTVTEPEGYVRTFVDEGRLLAPLLRQAVLRGISRDYAGKLLTIIEAEERQRLAAGREQDYSLSARGLLSQRELEVLRLLAEGLSNKEVASRLIISRDTAKNHVHAILEKLDVRNRTQAVAKARDLKLL